MSEEMIPDVEITSDVPERRSLAEIVKAFEELIQNEDRMKMSKEVEALKSAFYKTLAREKAESENPEEGPLAEIENVFKEMYNAYKKERSEYNRTLEQEALANLELKEAVIADLKALLQCVGGHCAEIRNGCYRIPLRFSSMCFRFCQHSATSRHIHIQYPHPFTYLAWVFRDLNL